MDRSRNQGRCGSIRCSTPRVHYNTLCKCASEALDPASSKLAIRAVSAIRYRGVAAEPDLRKIRLNMIVQYSIDYCTHKPVFDQRIWLIDNLCYLVTCHENAGGFTY